MKDSKKVLHVLWGLHAAGIENLALQLIKYSPKNIECDLLNLEPSTLDMLPEFNALINKECLGSIFNFSGKSWKLLYLSLVLARRIKPDGVIIYPCNSNMLWVALGMRLAGVKNVATCIQNTAPRASRYRQKWKRLLQLMLLLGVKLVSCSDAVVNSIRPLIPGAKYLPVIANGCDVVEIAKRAVSSVSSSSSVGRFRVGMVARLDQIKDQALLIQAFARCQSTVWDLVLVGDGPCRGALEELSRSCGLDPSKIFLGKRLDIPEILGSLDLFAFSTTDAEGFGIVLIEAMAAGLPVIASDVPACREVLADGAAGVLVSPGEVQAWTIRLGELMSQPKTRQRLAEASVTRAKTYGIEACASRWYQELIP